MRNNKRTQTPTGQVRIIGGDCRGRKLTVLNADGLRPTSDRVKETLFNWLQFDVPGAYCLDVFAGTGGLGFEAASRGAKEVKLLELNAANAKKLKDNQALLKLDNTSIMQTDSLEWLQQPAEKAFDIVFLDPPFHQKMMQKSLDLLFANHYLHSNSILYIEQEKQLEWPRLPEGWGIKKSKNTSQVRFAVFTNQT